MDKLQWFKFTPTDWIMGKIQRCPEATQARFLRLMCLYWNKECVLSLEDAELEIDKEHIDILLSKKVLKVVDDAIVINFLDEQLDGITEKSQKRKDAVKKRWNKVKQIDVNVSETNTNVIQNDTNVIQNEKFVLQNDTEKRREEKEKIILNKNTEFLNENLSSESWLEVQAMQNRISVEQIKDKLKEYNNYLFSCSDTKINKMEYNRHFTNWLKNNPVKSINTKKQTLQI